MMARESLALVIVLLLASVASARQPTETRPASQSTACLPQENGLLRIKTTFVHKITQDPQATQEKSGTGFLTVDSKGTHFVITAGHNIKQIDERIDLTENYDRTIGVAAGCNAGLVQEVVPVFESNWGDALDLAILQFRRATPEMVEPLRIAEPQNLNDTYSIYGYPEFTGDVDGDSRLTIRPPRVDLKRYITKMFGPGFSGAPVLNTKMSVIGIATNRIPAKRQTEILLFTSRAAKIIQDYRLLNNSVQEPDATSLKLLFVDERTNQVARISGQITISDRKLFKQVVVNNKEVVELDGVPKAALGRKVKLRLNSELHQIATADQIIVLSPVITARIVPKIPDEQLGNFDIEFLFVDKDSKRPVRVKGSLTLIANRRTKVAALSGQSRVSITALPNRWRGKQGRLYFNSAEYELVENGKTIRLGQHRPELFVKRKRMFALPNELSSVSVAVSNGSAMRGLGEEIHLTMYGTAFSKVDYMVPLAPEATMRCSNFPGLTNLSVEVTGGPQFELIILKPRAITKLWFNIELREAVAKISATRSPDCVISLSFKSPDGSAVGNNVELDVEPFSIASRWLEDANLHSAQ